MGTLVGAKDGGGHIQLKRPFDAGRRKHDYGLKYGSARSS
jgi:hypothetical protein